MFENWTFGRKLGSGFLFAVATTLLLAAFGHQSTQGLIENAGWVVHTHQVRRNISDLVSLLKDTETGQRGYVITGDEHFLEPYRAALPEFDRIFNDTRRLTADNPEQQRRLEALRPLVDAKLAELKATIEMRKREGFEPTARVVAGGEGKQIMDQIRRVCGEIDGAERDLLERRHAASGQSAQATKAILLWGSLLTAVLVAAFGAVIARSLGKQVSGAVHHIQSSSAELQAASSQQASGAKEQATAMNEISTTIRELLATSRQIAESAQRVAQIAEQTAAAAQAGDATVERGQESLATLRRQVDAIVNHMLDLGKKSQQIGAILEIVSELAEQTNILSINATIEAAGAGEAGRRFAVVADEIRKLADRVAGSTKEIRALIEDIRGAVNTTIMTTEGGSKAAEAGTKQFLEVAAAFRRISAQVATTTEAAREIGLSTKQQATAVEQLNVAITSVAQATKETEVSTAQTLQTASELADLSHSLLRIVQPQEQAAARG